MSNFLKKKILFGQEIKADMWFLICFLLLKNLDSFVPSYNLILIILSLATLFNKGEITNLNGGGKYTYNFSTFFIIFYFQGSMIY